MRILTGIQPSGKLHWGNYFGACLMKIGKRDLAEKILAKAKKLAESSSESH